MGSRLQLQSLLEGLLGSDAVYFQPPTNVTMVYPAIVYEEDSTDVRFADNYPYRLTKQYQVTYIDRSPDSAVPDKIKLLPQCRHSRSFRADNLNHQVFTLYF